MATFRLATDIWARHTIICKACNDWFELRDGKLCDVGADIIQKLRNMLSPRC